jgi:hypothetical protein
MEHTTKLTSVEDKRIGDDATVKRVLALELRIIK